MWHKNDVDCVNQLGFCRFFGLMLALKLMCSQAAMSFFTRCIVPKALGLPAKREWDETLTGNDTSRVALKGEVILLSMIARTHQAKRHDQTSERDAQVYRYGLGIDGCRGVTIFVANNHADGAFFAELPIGLQGEQPGIVEVVCKAFHVFVPGH